MKPAPFRYERPTTLDEAVALLIEDDEAKVIAGGQSLLPLLSLRLARPSLLVDLSDLRELETISAISDGHGEAEAIRLGAMVRHHRVASQNLHPLAAEAARWIGHTAIRSRGTIGGSLAHADPAAEMPALALALGAIVHVHGSQGDRRIPIEGFLVGPLQTTLAHDEVLVAIELPLPRRWGFAEVARKHGDFALVLVVAVELADGWRLVAGGLGGVPIRLSEAEALLNAEVANGEGDLPLAEVADLARATVSPSPNLHAGPGYLAAITGQLVEQSLRQAHLY